MDSLFEKATLYVLVYILILNCSVVLKLFNYLRNMVSLKVFSSVVVSPVVGRKCPFQMYQKCNENTSHRPFNNSSTGQAMTTFYQVHQTSTTHKSATSRQKLISKLVVLSTWFFLVHLRHNLRMWLWDQLCLTYLRINWSKLKESLCAVVFCCFQLWEHAVIKLL